MPWGNQDDVPQPRTPGFGCVRQTESEWTGWKHSIEAGVMPTSKNNQLNQQLVYCTGLSSVDCPRAHQQISCKHRGASERARAPKKEALAPPAKPAWPRPHSQSKVERRCTRQVCTVDMMVSQNRIPRPERVKYDSLRLITQPAALVLPHCSSAAPKGCG